MPHDGRVHIQQRLPTERWGLKRLAASAGLAWFIAGALALAAVAVAVIVVPWSSSVAPWAALPGPGAVSPDDASLGVSANDLERINRYQEASGVPLLLSWLAPVVVACIWWAATVIRPRPRQGRRLWLGTGVGLIAIVFAPVPAALWLAATRRDAGLSLRSAWSNAWSELATAGIVAVSVIVVVVVLHHLVRRWPRRWWQVGVPVAMIAIITGSWAIPGITANANLPAPPSLERELSGLAASAEVAPVGASVAEIADKSTTVNAVVTGYASTTHITVYDTLLAQLPPEQVDAVLAHEIAHVRHADVWWATVMAAFAGGAAVAGLAGILMHRSVRGKSIVLIAPLLAVMVTGVMAAASPVVATISRPIELRADTTAVAITGDQTALTEAIWSMTEINLTGVRPPRWRYVLFGTHPTPLQRVNAVQE